MDSQSNPPLPPRPPTPAAPHQPVAESSTSHTGPSRHEKGEQDTQDDVESVYATPRNSISRPARTLSVKRNPAWSYSADEKALPPDPTNLAVKTIHERLEPTIKAANRDQKKYARKAMMFSYSLNIAIGLQVVVGSMITGLSAIFEGHKVSIMTSVLGAISTVIASFLAKARGGNEPQQSQSHAKALELFLRDVRMFDLDHGDDRTHDYDDKIDEFRKQLDDLQSGASRVETGQSA